MRGSLLVTIKQGTGIREQGNGKRETGNRQQGTGNREQMTVLWKGSRYPTLKFAAMLQTVGWGIQRRT
jgi:hypothetical protein